MKWRGLAGAVAIVVLGSTAHAEVFGQAAYNAAVLKHAACTETAAVELAKKEGDAYRLALEALTACKAEEAENGKHASPETLQHVLGNVVYLRIRTIYAVRAGSLPDQRPCGDGDWGRWDSKLRVWRLPGR
jgi:hypothetical protein